jgi:hypothetical protein
VSAIIQNLSLKRLTDQEIVEYLHNEKQIEIARSTVTNTRNRIEKQAAKWYLDLRQSESKYISAYKQRIDSLLSYQKILHELIATTKREEIKVRAISELHSIEMDIFNLWKQLPVLDIVERVNQQKQEEQQSQQDGDRNLPIFDIEDINGVEEIPEDDKKYWHNWIQCQGCKRYWRGEQLLNYHKNKNAKSECSTAPQETSWT